PLAAASIVSQWLFTYLKFRLSDSGMKPRSPATFNVSELGLSPDTAIGGCGVWNGLICGPKRPSSIGSGSRTVQNLPTYSNGSVAVHSFRMISSDSRVISRCSPFMPSTLNIGQSVGIELAATPKLKRPLEMWSSIEARLANAAG